jgi:hypothetical protein
MISNIPSVKDTYFQHKVLTKIHGKPSYESLRNILTELKANASSVPSTLGGGQHGHLGLLLSDARYTALPHAIAWITPGNPGAFAPPPAPATGPQIEAAKDVWRELKRTFETSQASEKALIAQIVESIDSIYLRALLNRATGQYSTSIRALLLHLFTTYGQITPQQVKSTEMDLYNMHYEISQPVDTVFNQIDDLAELADHANSPMSQQQMIALAYVIFAKQPILQQDLRLWNRRPAIDRTWANMMDHLREAQTDLSSLPTAGDIYHQLPPHQANNVTDIADIVANRLIEVLGPPPDEEPTLPPTAEPISDAANSLQRRETDLQSRESAMMNKMQEMMMNMMRNNNQNNNQYNQYRGGRIPGGRGRGERGRGRGARGNAQPRSYCWSHGACAHSSAECNRQATGHQNTATFANMMNGSTTGCYWLNP